MFQGHHPWDVAVLLTGWAITLGALIIVPFRRSPEAAKGWLLLFFIAPWPAWIVYLFIGRPMHPKWRTERFKRLPEVIGEAAGRIFGEEDAPWHSTPDIPAASLARALGQLPTLEGNSVEFITDYTPAIDRLIQDIDGATEHVHLLFYIFADDGTGRRVMAALERAAERGITCRLLIDAMGSRPWARKVVRRMERAGVSVRLVLPLRFRLRTTRFDLRNHRKVAVIDGRIGYIGSQNITDATVSHDFFHRELVARIRGPVVGELQATFVGDWFLETEERLNEGDMFPRPERAGGVAAQILPSGPDYPDGGVDLLFVELIHGARKRVVVTTPYFIPNESLLTAMRTASLRGVDVHLVVSRHSDSVLVSFAQRSYYSVLMEAGVEVHLFRRNFLHAKHLSIDEDIVLLGSSNVDMRSFQLNAEISLIAYDRETNARMRAIEERYFADSDRLDRDEWSRRPLPLKVAENIARLGSPLL